MDFPYGFPRTNPSRSEDWDEKKYVEKDGNNKVNQVVKANSHV
jgi:hypothetical protein